MIIKVSNLLTETAPLTFMSVAKDSGVSTINVKNVSQFTASWAVQIGQTGLERSEVKLLGTATPSGTSLVLTANTDFEHPADTPVYAIKYDQVVFTRSTSGTSGVATPIGTVTTQADSNFTQFDDTTGLATYAYKAYFQNSVTAEKSSESDWLTSSGFAFYSLARMRQRVKDKLFNSGLIKTDDQIDGWINEWLEEMNNSAIKVDKSYSLGTVNVAFGSDGLGTITSTDYKDLKRIWITYNGVDKFKATKLDLVEMYPDEVYNSTHPYYIWRDDNVFEIQPKESGGTAELVYYKRKPLLSDDADELPVVMQSYSNSFVNYALSEVYYKDDKDDKGDRYLSRAQGGKNDFIKEITPRAFTGIQTIQITNVIDSDDDNFYY